MMHGSMNIKFIVLIFGKQMRK